MDVTISQPSTLNPKYDDGTPFDNMYNSSEEHVVFNPQDGLKITWHKAATDQSNGRSLDITWTITDIQNVPKDDPSNGWPEAKARQIAHGWSVPSEDSQIAKYYSANYIDVYSNPVDEIGWGNIAGFKVKEELTYSDTGEEYKGTYYRSAGSLNAQTQGTRWEFASPVSGVLASYISNDSLILPNEQAVSGKASAVASKAFMIGPNKESGPGLGGAYGDTTTEALTKEGVTFLVNNGSTIAYGVSGPTGSGKDAGPVTTDQLEIPSYGEHLMGSTGIVATGVPAPKSTVHYHYDTNLIGTNLRIIRLLLTMIVVSYFPIFSDYLFLQVLLQYVNMFSA